MSLSESARKKTCLKLKTPPESLRRIRGKIRSFTRERREYSPAKACAWSWRRWSGTHCEQERHNLPVLSLQRRQVVNPFSPSWIFSFIPLITDTNDTRFQVNWNVSGGHRSPKGASTPHFSETVNYKKILFVFHALVVRQQSLAYRQGEMRYRELVS